MIQVIHLGEVVRIRYELKRNNTMLLVVFSVQFTPDVTALNALSNHLVTSFATYWIRKLAKYLVFMVANAFHPFTSVFTHLTDLKMSKYIAFNAYQASSLVNGINSVYLRGSDLYLFDGETETKLEPGRDGRDGVDGRDGQNGADGASAFDIWKSQQQPKEPDYTYADYIAAITGPRGQTGAKGDTGERGECGETGATGNDGKDAFEVWRDHQPVRYDDRVIDYTYEEYITAITGPRGETGATGPRGETGATGPVGPKGDSDSTSWLGWLNTALNAGDVAGIAALESQINTLQGTVAALQAQVAGLAGTYAVGNTVNDVIDAADTLSDFSDVATEGRGLMDSVDNLLDGASSWLTNGTNKYTQIVNDYTSPALSNINNAQMLADVDTSLFTGLVGL